MSVLAIVQMWPDGNQIDLCAGRRALGQSSHDAAIAKTLIESNGGIDLNADERFVRMSAVDFEVDGMHLYAYEFKRA
jgi:hypothetical protein